MKKKLILIFGVFVGVVLLAAGAVSAHMLLGKEDPAVEPPYFVREERSNTSAVLSKNTNKDLKYQKSLTQRSGRVVDYYTDAQGNCYIYDEAGELIGYEPAESTSDSKQTVVSESVQLTEDQLLDAARGYAADAYGTEYTDLLTSSKLQYLESKQHYVVTLSYVYAGVCVESCDVEILPDGNLLEVYAPYKGEFEGLDLQKLKAVDMEQYVADRISQKEDVIDYEITGISLIKSGDKYQIEAAVVISYQNQERINGPITQGGTYITYTIQ